MAQEAEPTTGTDVLEGQEIVDELAGEELYDIPQDLLDDEAAGGEAPAGSSTDPSKEEPPARTLPPDTPRAPDGKFAKKDAASEAAQPAAQAPAVAQAPTQPSGEATPADASLPSTDTTVSAPALELSFTADGRQTAIPGSRVTDEGAFIPKEYVQDVQRLLSYGQVYTGSFKQRLQQAKDEVATARAEVHQEVEESKALLGFFSNLLEQGPVAVQDWLDNFERNRPMLEADARVAYAKALEDRKMSPMATEAPAGFDGEEDDFLAGVDRDQLMNNLGNVLAENLREVVVKGGVRGLTQEDVSRIHQAITSDPDEMERYFAYATEDIPDMQVKRGDVLVRQAQLLKRVQYEAGVVGSARKQSAEAAAADAENRRRGVGNSPPPTAGVAGSGAAKKQERPIPKTREELDAFMADDD